MEQYHRISHTVFPNEVLGVASRDEILNPTLNEKIAKWAQEMKSRYPKFRYRIVNGTDTDVWARTGKAIDAAMTATVHLVYEVE